MVIGKPAKYVEEADALSHVAGYCVINDLSERAFQLEGTGQWVKGKSADTFGPIGPWLVTPDEVPDPQNLEMWLEVDGHRYQNGSTRFEKRRYHLNRNAAWRRLWPKTTRLPASLQSHAIGHTWSRATEPGRRSRLADFLIDLMDFLIDKDRGSTLPCNCHMQSMLHQVFS